MADKVRCEICNRTFKDEDGLRQHNIAKHSSHSSDDSSGNKKSMKGWIIFLVIAAGIIAFIVWSVMGVVNQSSECKEAPAEEMNIGGHTNLALHIHQNLKIIINGEEQIIPPNIGIAPGIMRPVHTHDATGQLHVEGPCVRDFTIGDFFKIWGKEFNSQCIFDKCTDKGELTVTVNGISNNQFENLVLRDRDNIVIDYKEK